MTDRQNELLDRARNGDGAASQAFFESLFEGTPLVDTRPVSAINAGLSAQEYREMTA